MELNQQVIDQIAADLVDVVVRRWGPEEVWYSLYPEIFGQVFLAPEEFGGGNVYEGDMLSLYHYLVRAGLYPILMEISADVDDVEEISRQWDERGLPTIEEVSKAVRKAVGKEVERYEEE